VLGLSPCVLVYVPDRQSLQLDAPAETPSDASSPLRGSRATCLFNSSNIGYCIQGSTAVFVCTDHRIGILNWVEGSSVILKHNKTNKQAVRWPNRFCRGHAANTILMEGPETHVDPAQTGKLQVLQTIFSPLQSAVFAAQAAEVRCSVPASAVPLGYLGRKERVLISMHDKSRTNGS
jgi:hypothetical protein